MPENEDSLRPISEILPTISERIGRQARDETLPMPIGGDAGKVGCVEKPRAAPINPVTAPATANDETMVASLPPSVATSFKPVVYWGSDPERIGEIEDYEFGDAPHQDCLDALERLERWLVPAAHNDVVLELGKMRALVATRKEDDDSLSAIIGAFAEQIAAHRYPLDVVQQARLDYVSFGSFWPAWAEFREICDRLYLRRKSYYQALRNYITQTRPRPKR